MAKATTETEEVHKSKKSRKSREADIQKAKEAKKDAKGEKAQGDAVELARGQKTEERKKSGRNGEKLAVKQANVVEVPVSKVGRKTKNGKVARPPSPDPVFDEDAVNAEEEDADQDKDSVHLFGFSTDEDDSSDEEVTDEADAPGIDVKKLPTVAKDDAVVKQKLDKAKRKSVSDSWKL